MLSLPFWALAASFVLHKVAAIECAVCGDMSKQQKCTAMQLMMPQRTMQTCESPYDWCMTSIISDGTGYHKPHTYKYCATNAFAHYCYFLVSSDRHVCYQEGAQVIDWLERQDVPDHCTYACGVDGCNAHVVPPENQRFIEKDTLPSSLGFGSQKCGHVRTIKFDVSPSNLCSNIEEQFTHVC